MLAGYFTVNQQFFFCTYPSSLKISVEKRQICDKECRAAALLNAKKAVGKSRVRQLKHIERRGGIGCAVSDKYGGRRVKRNADVHCRWRDCRHNGRSERCNQQLHRLKISGGERAAIDKTLGPTMFGNFWYSAGSNTLNDAVFSWSGKLLGTCIQVRLLAT